MAEEIDFENGRNSNFEGLVTLTLTFDPAIRHIVLQQSSTSIPIYQISFKLKKLFVDGRTYGRTFFPSILLGRLSEVDLIIIDSLTRRSAVAEAARCSTWLKILLPLSHSRSFEFTRLTRPCVSSC